LNIPPSADAGPDHSVDEGDMVTLDGSNSSDPDDGIASARWTQLSGIPVNLSDPAAFQPTFLAPHNSEGEALTFQLTVMDNGGLTSQDTCTVTLAAATVYEDAEDDTTKGWFIYDNRPRKAKISNVFDEDRQSRVIQFQGAGTKNGYVLRNTDWNKWRNTSQFVIQWSMKYEEDFVVYLDVETTAGHRYIYYTPDDYDDHGSGEYVHHGLGSLATAGQWHTFTRDLQADLEDAQPGINILEVNGFLIRGSGRMDEIKLLYSHPSEKVYEDAEDSTTAGWYTYDNDPAGATISNVYDEDRQSRVIQLDGAGTKNGYVLRNTDWNKWRNTSQFVIQWSMKYEEDFVVYLDVETTAGHRYIYYTPDDYDDLGSGEYVHHGLGSIVMAGQWRTFTRDLQADLEEAQPDVRVIEVNGFLIRGSGKFDDILLRS